MFISGSESSKSLDRLDFLLNGEDDDVETDVALLTILVLSA